MSNLIATAAVFAVLTIYFCLIGIVLLAYLLPRHRMSAPLLWGGAFFLGMTWFMVVFRLLNFALRGHANILLWLTLAIGFGLLLLGRRSIQPVAASISVKGAAATFALICGCYATTLLIWLIPHEFKNMDAIYWHIGSGHPGRYASIAYEIVRQKWIPDSIPQHFGSPILLSVFLFLGLQRVYLILHVWLALSLAAATLCCFGLLQQFIAGRATRVASAVIVLCGNSALSILHVFTIDSGNPLFANGQTDSFILMGTSVLLLQWAQAQLSEDGAERPGIGLPALLLLGWCFVAEQGVLVFLPAILTVLALSYRRSGTPASAVMRPAIVLLAALVIGVLQGGALKPKMLVAGDGGKIPGVPSAGDAKLVFYPFMPHGVASGFIESGTWHTFFTDPEMLDLKSLDQKTITQKIWTVESRFWVSLRIVFFPLLGIVLLAYCTVRRGDKRLEPLLIVGALAVAIGYVLTFFLSAGPFKWEMTRAFLPGYLFGMIALVVSLNSLLVGFSGRQRTAIWGTLCLFLCAAPAFNYSAGLTQNMFRNGAFSLYLTYGLIAAP